MSEVGAAIGWIVGRLSTAPALSGRVYAEAVPPGAAQPYLLLRYREGEDHCCAGGLRAATWLRFDVEALSQGESFLPAEALLDAADTLLHRSHGEAPGCHVLSCMGERPTRALETSEGRSFARAGRVYRLWLTPVEGGSEGAA